MAASNLSESQPKGSQLTDADATKQKVEQIKKAQIFREIYKLNVQIQALERERSTHIFSKRSDFRQDFSSLEEISTTMLEDLQKETEGIKQHLAKTNHMIKRFHQELINIRPSPEYVERLKIIMEEIETAINTLKEEQKQKFEELIRNERTLEQELQALERKFEAWAQPTTGGATTSQLSVVVQRPLSSARDITKDLPPEVAAFEKFLQQTGGHRGDWDEYDHGTFLKFRNRFKGKMVFLDHLKGPIPTKTEEEIRDHELWYQEYLFLKERKKDGIKNWREKKEEEKEDILIKAQEHEGQTAEDEEEQRKKVLQEKIEQEKHERFSQLNSWKVQKELEKAIKEEKKLKEERARVKKQEEDKQRQAEIRGQVEQFRKQREEEEKFIKEQTELLKRQEEEHRRQDSAREIVKFRTRDIQKLHERLAKEVQKENEQKEKEQQLERLKYQVEVERDPCRLLQPTAGWKSRLKDKSSGGGQILHMPHRAIPSWRKS